MKITAAFLSSIHLFTNLASAHPFFIVDAHITVPAVLPPTPTHHVARQNLLSDLQSAANSILGISTATSTTSRKTSTTISSSSSVSVRTLGPPLTASSSTSSARQRITSSSTSTDDSDNQTSTSSDDGSSTSTTSVSSTSTSSSVILTSTSATSAQSSPTPTGNVSQPAPTTNTSNDDSGAVPPGGIAVAVIMVLLILAIGAWLVFRYHPKCRAWWAARQAKKFEERSYRDAIDGHQNLRSTAMGSGAPSRRQTMLKSFFAPTTVKLGNGQEIRRKPVNWGAETSSTRAPSFRSESPSPPPLPIDMEKIFVESDKIPMTAAAAPMGQIERYSYVPKARPQGSGPPVPEKVPELPAIPHSAIRQLTPAVPAHIQELPARPLSTAGLEVAPPTPSKSPEVPAKTPELPAKTRSSASAVSPMSLHPHDDMERLPPISPISHHGAASRELPELPPLPAIPGLNLAKRGSDGVFRLA